MTTDRNLEHHSKDRTTEQLKMWVNKIHKSSSLEFLKLCQMVESKNILFFNMVLYISNKTTKYNFIKCKCSKNAN